MQQAPCRLSQTLWSAFRAAKPIRRPQALRPHPVQKSSAAPWHISSPIYRQARFYSDASKDVDRKVEDAKARIDDTIEARAEAVVEPEVKVKPVQEETIVKTDPVSSSIVEPASRVESGQGEQRQPPTPPEGSSAYETLAATTANVKARFFHFMDNFQSHLFVASRRLNDLTGYTTIEQLKNDIAAQENLVQQTRQQVKDAREKYSSAIAKRSTTQREVNDLLHRKHAWTPTDLERFTNLYRSDHENELEEIAAQRDVAEAETRYEEASTKLGRAILARYHEEQVWSDKIRQMSTWGTWGLMGLNVLLFVVFQILVEPWRRRRLVRGFEEKVELALQERDVQLAGLRDSVDSHAAATAAAAGRATGGGREDIESDALPSTSEARADAVAEAIAEHIADAVSGASPPSSESSPTIAPSLKDIEAAADTVVAKEIAQDTNDNSPPPQESGIPSQAALEGLFASTTSGYAYYVESFQQLWSEERTMIITQRELTTHVLEGALGGAALMGLLMALLRPR